MLGALVNAVFLVALCFSITVESLKRFYEPEDIHDPQESDWIGRDGKKYCSKVSRVSQRKP